MLQRPQHLIARAARTYRVVFFEEPVEAPASDRQAPRLLTRVTPEGIVVAVPLLPPGLDNAESDAAQRALLDRLLAELHTPLHVSWYCTPLALAFTAHLLPTVTVFDNVDELSAFQDASPRLPLLERRLLRRADLVFTAGRSLHEAKSRLHGNVHLFRASVDAAHFGTARNPVPAQEPDDQAGLPCPRLGFFGVLDERIDLGLVAGIAARRPDWQLIMIGPAATIDPASLPRRPNLHWLGMKPYAELPAYLAHWDIALMPFARNAATRFISPAKTPEYLAAGLPVISTPVVDVVADWGRDGLVEIASDADGFVRAAERLRVRAAAPWLARVDERLRWMSWDATWARMARLIADLAKSRQPGTAPVRTQPINDRRRGAVWSGAPQLRCVHDSEADKPA